MVTRLALLKELAAIISDDVLVVASIGNNSGFWGQLKEREANLFHVTMGMCTPTALGLALALPNRKVIALDSDGNLILNLGVLGTIANENPQNLMIIVMNNHNYLGSHKDEPGMPTATSGKMNLEGVARHVSTHAAGVVISKEPLTQIVPLQRPTRSDDGSQVLMTQFAMDPIAALGLLKVDFLGLANLTVLDKARGFIRQTQGVDVDPQRRIAKDGEGHRFRRRLRLVQRVAVRSRSCLLPTRMFVNQAQPATMGLLRLSAPMVPPSCAAIYGSMCRDFRAQSHVPHCVSLPIAARARATRCEVWLITPGLKGQSTITMRPRRMASSPSPVRLGQEFGQLSISHLSSQAMALLALLSPQPTTLPLVSPAARQEGMLRSLLLR